MMQMGQPSQAAGGTKAGTFPPLNSLAILGLEAGINIFSTGAEEIRRLLYNGVILHNDEKDRTRATHKFWVNDKLNKNCYLVLSSTLVIIWGDSPEYWEHVVAKENCSLKGEVDIYHAVLQSVCWLDVKGRFRTMALSPKTTYEVAFFMTVGPGLRGFYIPVRIFLHLPDGSKIERSVKLDDVSSKGEWISIPIGTFMMGPKNIGELQFGLMETGNQWKSGITIKGVTIQPLD